jgi:hypothetical protein
MAARSRRPEAAELGHRIWEHLHGRAEERPGEFRPATRDDVTGWLWDGVLANMIREAVPGIADSDLRRAREYLNASGMVVNMGGDQRGAGPPQWFIRAGWHQGPGGHVHVVTPLRLTCPACRRQISPQRATSPPTQEISRARTSRRHCRRWPGRYPSCRQTTTGCTRTMTGSVQRSGAFGPSSSRQAGKSPAGSPSCWPALKTNRCPDR